jgi:hypothetical protein
MRVARKLFPDVTIKNDDEADAILIGYSYTQKEKIMNWGD